MRDIRLVSGLMRCIRCDKGLFRTNLQAGWGFQTCEHKRCDAEFWTLALPPDCFGGWLASVCGDREAAYLITRCWPHLAASPPPKLWYETLTPPDEQHWIQIGIRPRERHLYRTSKLPDFLPHLLRSAA